MFRYIFPLVLIFLVLLDRVFLPKSARRAWTLMSSVFVLCALMALFPKPIEGLAQLMGVGRGVDVIMYFALAVLVREFFISRYRQMAMQVELTKLVRALALQGARQVNAAADHAPRA